MDRAQERLSRSRKQKIKSFRLSTILSQKLEKRAKKDGVNDTAVITIALEKYLN